MSGYKELVNSFFEVFLNEFHLITIDAGKIL
jgi:hypothetical protein